MFVSGRGEGKTLAAQQLVRYLARQQTLDQLLRDQAHNHVLYRTTQHVLAAAPAACRGSAGAPSLTSE